MPSVRLSQQDFKQLVYIIQRQPSFVDEVQRRNLITLIFGFNEQANSIISQLDLSGTPMNAAVTLVNFLCQYGQVEYGIESLGMMLDQLLSNMGISEDADFLADIITRYKLAG